MILDGQKLSFEMDISEVELIVNIDASLVERAVRNLLDNAIRYGRDGHFLGIGLLEDGHNPSIKVKDTGKGVAPEYHERIFERFIAR